MPASRRRCLLSAPMASETRSSSSEISAYSTVGRTMRREKVLPGAPGGHGQHEEQTGRPDADWPDWYGLYLELEQAGLEHLLTPGPP